MEKLRNPEIFRKDALSKMILIGGSASYGMFFMGNKETNWFQWAFFIVLCALTLSAAIIYLYKIAEERKKPEVIFHLEILMILLAISMSMTMKLREIEAMAGSTGLPLLCFVLLLLTGGIYMRWHIRSLRNDG